jgi:hypothetical protein
MKALTFSASTTPPGVSFFATVAPDFVSAYILQMISCSAARLLQKK